MSEILHATCNASGVVSADGVTVASAVVLSEGKQSSEGLLFLEGDRADYLPSSATDIKTTIEKLETSLGKLADVLTTISTSIGAIGAVTGPAWAPPPVLATGAASINAKVVEINAIKTELTTLKGALK